MKITEISKNILELDSDKIIVHSISNDFTLGAGIAKQLNTKYNLSYYLFRDFDECLVGDVAKVGNIFNLIVKETYKNKVNEDDVFQSLLNLKAEIEKENIKEIHMPRICCGHEKMQWEEIKNMLEDVFSNMDIDIFVYHLPNKLNQNTFVENDKSEISAQRKCHLYKQLLKFAVSMIPDEDDIYSTLLSIGFTEEEIKQEGYLKHWCNKNAEGDCDCGGNCKCHTSKESTNDYNFDTGM